VSEPFHPGEPDPAYALDADDDEDLPEPVKPLVALHRWLVRALILFMIGQAANAAYAATDLVAYQGIVDTAAAPANDLMHALNVASPYVAGVYFGTLAIAGACYLRFIYRAVANVKKFSARYLSDSPLGSVIWHFVPGLSLIKPYRIMRVVWIRSHGGPSDDGDGPPTGAVWWISWLILTFAGGYASFTQNFSPETNVAAADLANRLDVVNIIGSLGGIASALLLMPITRGIAQAQDFVETSKVFEDGGADAAATSLR
jgi:hypothetical protein